MAKSILLKSALIINEDRQFTGDILIKNGRIETIGTDINKKADMEINAEGKILIPGIIDDQVHFREPGITYKADIHSESRAAVSGGVTSYMDMPNTKPAMLTQELLETKYQTASQKSLANYSFYMGVSNDNLEEVLKTDPKTICGIKIFMGSSTGNMLVDDEKTLRSIFSESNSLIATHCEDEAIVRGNEENARYKYGEKVPIDLHPFIRSAEACYKSSAFAVSLAREFNSRLHILHLSTAREMGLFDNKTPIKDKRITAEVCVHHLWFDDADYKNLGSKIKCNPAIKTDEDRKAIFKAMLENYIDVIATDHAPHTREEKQNTYFKSPSGIPLVQHALNMMLDFHHRDMISLEKIVEKMCHAPAIAFNIRERGFIREGNHADLALIDLNHPWKVSKQNIYYKCGWSPLEGQKFNAAVTHTFVNGDLVYELQENKPSFNEKVRGKRLTFNI
jgi:dihydroorotase